MIAGPLINTDASIRYSLRALALRFFLLLEQETNDHEKVLDLITADAVPTLRDAYGIGPECAAK
jgi:hypothetical protein